MTHQGRAGGGGGALEREDKGCWGCKGFRSKGFRSKKIPKYD